jgi:phosphate:Na+ symporter
MNTDQMKLELVSMAAKISEVLDLIEKGFLEHKTEILSDALKKEHEVNESERSLVPRIMEASASTKDKKGLIAIAQAVETLERMGDEAVSLIERIEIKIAEKLLFSDEGVGQFNEVYDTMKRSVAMMRQYLEHPGTRLKDQVIDNGFQVKRLVERYRQAHSERMVQGICTPLEANMYFDMLDFTGNLARHASNIVKAL